METKTSTRPVIDLAKAIEVAQILRQDSRIHAVELFGSVARDGVGHDLDLVLIVREEYAQEFMETVSDEITIPWNYSGTAMTRTEVTETVFDCFPGDSLDKAITLAEPIKLDLFLFPRDWRDRLDELQSAMPHGDSEFMRKIARDARPIA